MTQLPLWLQVMQALLTPAIALAVGVIAFMQWRTAHQKVVLDLFERRMAVYLKLKKSMSLINTSGKVSEASERLLLDVRNEAEFLFGPDIVEYLEELWLVFIQAREYEGRPPSQSTARRLKLMETVSDFYKRSPDRFAPYMRMDQRRVGTPGEWLAERNQKRLSYADEHQR